ncbi:MAG: GNAT family N-acetyltransferase [Patescibacteria group bacterium]|nr:GNAT family N-acetyltransferase [Patescibacteria group bacterium]
MLRQIKFRKAKLGDLRTIFEIGKIHFDDEKWLKMKFIENSFMAVGYYYIAEYKREPVGGIMVTKYDFPKNWIFYLVVHPKYQRKGIGSQLLKLVENDIKKDSSGSNFLYVDIGINDEVAKNFYLKNRFEIQGKVNNWFGDGMSCLILGKKII